MANAPRRTLALPIAAGAAAVALGAVAALDAVEDAAAMARSRVSLAEFEGHTESRALDRAAPALRNAAESARPVLDGGWVRHAWTRAFRGAQCDALRAELDAALARLDREVTARQARVAALRTLRAEVDYAATIKDLDAVEVRRATAADDLAAESPAAHEDLVRALGDRRADFGRDVDRNRAALAELREARDRARGDAEALQRVVDSVLPAPSRAGEGEELAALARSAAGERGMLLGSRRIGAAVAAADAAAGAEAVGRIAAELEQDQLLLRGADEPLLAARAAALAGIRQREGALRAWEADLRAIDGALAAGEPGAALVALGRLRACDERTAAAASALRGEFGGRAVESLVRGTMAAVDSADVGAMDRMARTFAPGAPIRALLSPADASTADRVSAEVERAIDRELYEQFRRNPSSELADRYLQAWPAARRAMAPAVMCWKDSARDNGTTLSLDEVRWGTIGTRATARTLEDRPDATIEVVVNGRPATDARVADIRERTSSGLNDAVVAVPGRPWDELEVGILGEIDLRDAILSDPKPRGGVRQSVGAWRAARATEVAFADPTWPGSPHVAILRATVSKTPSLPPFQGRQR